ncbi:DNA-binding protein [Pseudomonas aeruginosa]|uniref:Putative cointegrate resolution protein n=1 Tax=Pseudomonas paraeruginosa (strain DSM 24068 / PA7) TaxID=381754 RepID=A6V5R8_PSEP7|nr:MULTISPECIES: DNA-binding protein [Pseudomonas aeruginosa group]ABR81339.1 putative cointegrate resolution protein [Pseudomonas aeruginosa PA7]KSC92732.1 plasmid replication region [Pseudomonas aeruginosa]KSD26346.1 plasmid replication region [Pseudomonas aeruginosa]KSG58396.1 plasmid replication region [Pseudomonas aeruginosa]MCW8362992.1 DNA-binding protein [Pseudomonas aeruginosa]
MAVGVPETEVFAAADAVLARGERPTVERVRLELGRGSPARVGALLDQWWERLAQRLRGETRLPALPAEVAQAFVAIWQQAMLLADGVAEQALAERRTVLEAERLRVAAVENESRQAVAQARQQVAAAQAAQQSAETRLADLELLLVQRQAQLDDLQSRCVALTTERKEALHDASILRQELQAAQRQLTREHESSASYVRGVEDRAHREVDRAREESRAAAAQLKTAGKQQEQLRQRLDTALAQLSEAQQLAAAESARALTLAQQLSPPVRTRRASTKPTKSAKPAKRADSE